MLSRLQPPRDPTTPSTTHLPRLSLPFWPASMKGKQPSDPTALQFHGGLPRQPGSTRHRAEGPAALTRLHAVLGVPDGEAVAVQVLLALPVDFEVHLQLPVAEVARLQEEGRGREIGEPPTPRRTEGQAATTTTARGPAEPRGAPHFPGLQIGARIIKLLINPEGHH